MRAFRQHQQYYFPIVNRFLPFSIRPGADLRAWIGIGVAVAGLIYEIQVVRKETGDEKLQAASRHRRKFTTA